jgi:quercetin dioxygenase-like cupin family protein
MKLGSTIVSAALLAAGVSGIAIAADMPGPTGALKATVWGPAPPVLPAGAQLAVMAGDPSKTGFVSLRLKLPAHYVIPPHTHPTDEHVTVLSGTMALGMGDKVDPKATIKLMRGGYAVAVAGMHHYAMTLSPTIVQVDMEGPFQITYVNPADDPQNRKPGY